jgi:glycosyltransferase involved in cell wall biosynthesis
MPRADFPEAPLRILYVSGTASQAFLGGIETYGRELIRGLRSRGQVVEVLEASAESVYAHSSPRDLWPASPFRQRYYFWKRTPHEDYRYHVALRRQTRAVALAFRPDVIHSLHTHRFGAAIATRLPVIVSAYGLEVGAAPPVLGSLRRANVIHAISDFTAGLVKAAAPDLPDPRVLRWGIVKTGTAPADGGDFDVITVSRLVRRKNVDTVLRAMHKLGDLRYAVVGDGAEIGALQDLARTLGLRRTVFFGSVPDEERERLLSRSRLFVMCPRADTGDVEGLGLVYYEALGAGLPIVAANSGGAPEAVINAGLLVQSPDDAAELADTIRQALSPETHDRLRKGVAARQDTDSWKSFIDRFEALYSDAAGMRT